VLTGSDVDGLSKLVSILPFCIAILVQLATMCATWAVSRQVEDLIGRRLTPEEIHAAPRALQPPAVRDYVEWGIDAAGALAAPMIPLLGFVILLPSGLGPVASLCYVATFLISLVLFVTVMHAASPGRYLALLRRGPRPLTLVAAVSLTMNTLAGALTWLFT